MYKIDQRLHNSGVGAGRAFVPSGVIRRGGKQTNLLRLELVSIGKSTLHPT